MKWMIYACEETVRAWYVSWHVHIWLSLICWYKEIMQLRLSLNSSATCRENRYINVEFIWDMCKYTNNVVVWCLYKCQTVDWMVIYLFIWCIESVSI